MPAPKLALWAIGLTNATAGNNVYQVEGGVFPAFIGTQGGFGAWIGGYFRGRDLVAYGGNARCKVFYDQSGNGNDVTRDVRGPLVCDNLDVLVLEANTPVQSFNQSGEGSCTLTRGDALGLVADPALTIAWKMRVDPASVGPGLTPVLLALGTAASPEINVFFERGLLSDLLGISDFSGANGLDWNLPLSLLDGWHSYLITKPAGSGYTAVWTLSIDGVDQGAPTAAGVPALAVGATNTTLGDEPAAAGGGFPFGGRTAGLLLWDSVLSASDLVQLQGFLDSQ